MNETDPAHKITDRPRPTDIFRTIVDPNGQGLTSPLNDPIKSADNTLGRQRKVHLNPQPLTIIVVQHIEQTECPAIRQPVGHKVHRPDRVGRIGNSQVFRLLAFQPLTRLDPQVQRELAINPIDALVVPGVPPNVPQMQEA